MLKRRSEIKHNVTPKDIAEIAEKFGSHVEYKRYRMWRSVPHIGKTAIAIDETVIQGGERLVLCEDFPSIITREYVERAIENGAYSLGKLDSTRYDSHFIPWDKLVGEYPKGYFTHKIGTDVSSK